MKNTYIAVQFKENNKYHADIIKINKGCNLVPKLKANNIIVATICETKKEAEEIINTWNNSFKNNETYLFNI